MTEQTGSIGIRWVHTKSSVCCWECCWEKSFCCWEKLQLLQRISRNVLLGGWSCNGDLTLQDSNLCAQGILLELMAVEVFRAIGMKGGKKFLRTRTASTTNQDLRDKDSSNFRTPTNLNIRFSLVLTQEEPQERKDKRRWIFLVKKKKKRRKLLR